MLDETLTLTEAATRYGVSVTTLRRLMKSGMLVPLPRQSERDAYKVTSVALAAAGLHLDTRAYSLNSQGLSNEIEILRAEILRLTERAGRAEGALAATRADFESLRDAIAPALAVLSERAQPTPAVIEYSSPRRRWWQRATPPPPR